MRTFHFQKIKQYREQAGLSQVQLAEKIGVMVQQLWSWEHCGPEKSMTAGNLAKIAEALGRHPGDFFIDEGKGDNRQNPEIPARSPDLSSGQQ